MNLKLASQATIFIVLRVSTASLCYFFFRQHKKRTLSHSLRFYTQMVLSICCGVTLHAYVCRALYSITQWLSQSITATENRNSTDLCHIFAAPKHKIPRGFII